MVRIAVTISYVCSAVDVHEVDFLVAVDFVAIVVAVAAFVSFEQLQSGCQS